MNARYVILKHITPPGYPRPLHWDLMLEDGATLRTWALSEEPNYGVKISAEELAPHRLAYLDFEGEISRGRGTVQRFDAGQFCWITQSEDALCARLAGQEVSGHVTLQRHENTWQALFSRDKPQ